MNEKIKTKLGKVQETLVLPLWGRAMETKKSNPQLIDNKAVEMIERIDYDFSTITEHIHWLSQLAWVARCLHIDKIVGEFINTHPSATIINIGCGLDTTFERIDNGTITFYDLDLPDVIALRREFFQDHERRKTVTSSFLEPEWFQQILVKDGLLCIAAGVFYYFNERQIQTFFKAIADHFEQCEIVFDTMSPLGVRVANKKVIQAGGMDETAILKWGMRSAKILEKWDPRFTLMQIIPIYRGVKKAYPIKMRCSLWLWNSLKISSIVHVKLAP